MQSLETIGTLTFFCGKMGAGKSTRSKVLCAQQRAVLISEDEWITALYPGHVQSFDDYVRLSNRMKPLIRSLVRDILRSGADVVMDFPANTIQQRKWFKDLCSDVGCGHEMHFLDSSDEECLMQIQKRRVEQPDRARFDTEAVYWQVTKFFELPTDAEGINIVHVPKSA